MKGICIKNIPAAGIIRMAAGNDWVFTTKLSSGRWRLTRLPYLNIR